MNKEHFLFFLRWLRHPRQVGSVAPSSQQLAKLIAGQVKLVGDDVVVEIGGGTGSLTEGLLNAGIKPGQLFVIEKDLQFFRHLQTRFPHLSILYGDVQQLPSLLPKSFIGKAAYIVSGIPMLNLDQQQRKHILDACFACMSPGASFLQYTYKRKSPPILGEQFGLSSKCVGRVLRNIPPATVWSYQRSESISST